MKKLFTGMAIAACFLSACSSKSSTGSASVDSTAVKLEKNKQSALASEKAVVAKDVDGLVKDCAKDFVDYGSGEGKPMKNIDSIKAGLKAFYTAFPDYKGEHFSAVASGDSVVVIGEWSGTFKAAFMGMKPNGKTFKYTDADIFTFDKDGKMTSHRSVQSEAAPMSQLGILPPAAK